MSFVSELKRRNVIRVGILYLVSSWVLLQLTDVLSSLLPVPEWAGSLVVMLLVLGFVPALLFSWVYEMTPEGLKREKDVDHSQSITHESGHKINTLIAVLLVVAIAGLVVDRLIPEENTATPIVAGKKNVQPTKDKSELASIAVLPFDDLSPDQDQRYFTDGISEELLNVLVRVDGLRVASRTSAFGFRGKDLNIPEIAGELGVATVLEGSVRKDGNRIRITAQLIDGATDSHLWSQTYDRDLMDIFKIQDEIANAIVDSLRNKLGISPAEKVIHVVAATDNQDAYDLFLQAQALLHARQNLDKSIQLFARATQIDPDFARAWAGLAAAHTVADDWLLDGMDHSPQAREAAQHALELDPDLSMAYAVQGLAQRGSNSFRRRLSLLDTAIEKDPKSAIAWLWRGISFKDAGLPSKALPDLQQCLQIDPQYLNCQQHLALTYLLLGEHDKAVAVYEKTLGSGFHSVDEAFIGEYLRRGNIATALLIADMKTGSQYAPVGDLIQVMQSPDADREKALQRFERWAEVSEIQLNEVMFVLLYLGAYDRLEMNYNGNKLANFVWLAQAAEFRQTDGFRNWLLDQGYVNYWREFGFPAQCRPVGADDFACD